MPVAAQLQRVLVAAVLATDPPRIGPFAVLLDPSGSSSPFRNYASPASAHLPTEAELSELFAVFAGRGLRPRFEYVEQGDALTDVLTAAGCTVAQRIALMALDALVPPAGVPGVSVRAAESDEDLLGAATVMAIAYGDDEPAERGAARLRGTLERGGAVSVATAQGTVVGAGLHSAARAGWVELAAVATHPERRRRGIAANVGADLVRRALAAGAQAFLQAEGDAEARIYARIGFVRCGSMVFADGPATAG